MKYTKHTKLAVAAFCLLLLSRAQARPVPLCDTSIFPPDMVPVLDNFNDGPSIEVGTKFNSSVAGNVVGARFWVSASNTGANTATLWTAGGFPLGSVVIPPFVGPGWTQVLFPGPIPISAGTTYIISVLSPDGWYSATHNVFDSAVINPPLRGLGSGEDGPNGVYQYGGGFPTSTFANSGYFVDVVFESPCQEFDLSWFTIDAGGGTSTDGTFTVSGTIGQPDTGRMTGAPYFSVMAGYWGAVHAAPTCACDLNNDGQVDDFDFVMFAAAYDILDCADVLMPIDCPSDFNADNFVDDADFVIFVAAYDELLCP